MADLTEEGRFVFNNVVDEMGMQVYVWRRYLVSGVRYIGERLGPLFRPTA